MVSGFSAVCFIFYKQFIEVQRSTVFISAFTWILLDPNHLVPPAVMLKDKNCSVLLTECDKDLKVSHWPQNSPNLKLIEHVMFWTNSGPRRPIHVVASAEFLELWVAGYELCLDQPLEFFINACSVPDLCLRSVRVCCTAGGTIAVRKCCYYDRLCLQHWLPSKMLILISAYLSSHWLSVLSSFTKRNCLENKQTYKQP